MRKIETMTPSELADYMNGIGGCTQTIVPPGCGFVVLVMDERRNVHYVSNCDRGDVTTMLLDVGNRFSRGILSEPIARIPETGPFAGWSDAQAWRLVEKRTREIWGEVGHRTKLMVEELGRLATQMIRRIEGPKRAEEERQELKDGPHSRTGDQDRG